MSVLLAGLLSGTLGAVTLAVTVAPVVVSGTVIGALWVWPGASVTGASVVVTPLITTTGVNVTVVLPLLERVTVVVTVVPGLPEGIGFTSTPGSLNSGVVCSPPAWLSTSLLLAVLLSGVVVATVLVASSTAPIVLGTVVVKVCVTLAPGARSPTVKVRTSPLLRVTVPTVALAVVPAAALLVKVTVTVTTLPAGAVVGRSTSVLTSANCAPPSSVSVLLAGLLSGTLGAVTLAVTVAPVVVSGTVIGALWVWPGASVTGASVVVTPLITTTGGERHRRAAVVGEGHRRRHGRARTARGDRVHVHARVAEQRGGLFTTGLVVHVAVVGGAALRAWSWPPCWWLRALRRSCWARSW